MDSGIYWGSVHERQREVVRRVARTLGIYGDSVHERWREVMSGVGRNPNHFIWKQYP